MVLQVLCSATQIDIFMMKITRFSKKNSTTSSNGNDKVITDYIFITIKKLALYPDVQ